LPCAKKRRPRYPAPTPTSSARTITTTSMSSPNVVSGIKKAGRPARPEPRLASVRTYSFVCGREGSTRIT
jgi:hypothetical protein